MQDKKVKKARKRRKFGIIKLPIEVMEEAGFTGHGTLEVETGEGVLILRKIEAEDLNNYVCDRKCKKCPVQEQCQKGVE